MICKIADNILSPLGLSTAENYHAVIKGNSAIKEYDSKWNLPFAFFASLFSEEQRAEIQVEGFTQFESMVLGSVSRALAETSFDIQSNRVIFILSSTKGNIAHLKADGSADQEVSLGKTAEKIASYLGFTTAPVVVCNACISGLSAIILAKRLLETRNYDYAVICGADEQSDFIVSGFHSFMALSPASCKPFDMERMGLNLGEAAATIVLQNKEEPGEDEWKIQDGVIRNDAYHISTPSPKGKGAQIALEKVIDKATKGHLSFINCHGTATMFNDQMEAVAISGAGIDDIPVNAYKGYLGHTLGAAGVLETILSIYALDHNTIPGTYGFHELGVSGNIKVTAELKTTDKKSFVKMLSGFGGGNAALIVSKEADEKYSEKGEYIKTHEVEITSQSVIIDGSSLIYQEEGKALLTAIYKDKVADYPRFYKMDGLSRLGFIASELLLQAEGKERFIDKEDRGIVLFNRTSSVVTEKIYLKSIENRGEFYPSPADFVYTLPNIVTGEIAIRNHYYGETSFYILSKESPLLEEKILKATFAGDSMQSIISGWLDYENDNHFKVRLAIYERKE